MFTIEHEFDATVITLIDDDSGAGRPLQADVTITAFDDRVVVEQPDPETEGLARVVLSIEQLNELRAALSLPEGSYRLDRSGR